MHPGTAQGISGENTAHRILATGQNFQTDIVLIYQSVSAFIGGLQLLGLLPFSEEAVRVNSEGVQRMCAHEKGRDRSRPV